MQGTILYSKYVQNYCEISPHPSQNGWEKKAKNKDVGEGVGKGEILIQS